MNSGKRNTCNFTERYSQICVSVENESTFFKNQKKALGLIEKELLFFFLKDGFVQKMEMIFSN